MKHRAGEIPCDEALFERLRTLRRTLADARDVPAYIIFSDVALREMANKYPASEAEFGRIAGVGKQKLREFAQVFSRRSPIISAQIRDKFSPTLSPRRRRPRNAVSAIPCAKRCDASELAQLLSKSRVNAVSSRTPFTVTSPKRSRQVKNLS